MEEEKEDGDNSPPVVVRGDDARAIYVALGRLYVKRTDSVSAEIHQDGDRLSVKGTSSWGSNELIWDYGGNSVFKESFTTGSEPMQTIVRLLAGGKVEVTQRELNYGREKTVTPNFPDTVRARVRLIAGNVAPLIRRYVW
jgi:hypothetical protein